jgi:hypothetical protein
MSSFRGLNSTLSTPSPSPPKSLLNLTSNALTVYLRSSAYHPNMTSEEITLALGDPSIPSIPKLNNDEIILMCGLIICCSLGVLLAHILEKNGITQHIKQKILTLDLTMWIKSKYVELTKKNVLPLYHPKKAKESPFVSSMPMPQILPQCPRLEGAEKGQNNLQVRFSIPYRRFHSSDDLPSEAEHRITITTVVEQSQNQNTKN